MSRFYEMNLEVKKATIDEEEFKKIEKVFRGNWGYDPDGCILHFAGSSLATLGCQGTLCGGESEEEAHEHIRDNIKKEIGECTVATQWTYLEELPYTRYED